MSCRSAQKIKNRLEKGGEVEDVEEMGIAKGVAFFLAEVLRVKRTKACYNDKKESHVLRQEKNKYVWTT